VHTGTDGPRCRRPSPPSQSWPMPRVLFLCSRRTFIGPRGLVHLGGGCYLWVRWGCCKLLHVWPRPATHARASHQSQPTDARAGLQNRAGNWLVLESRMCTTGTQTHVHHWYADACALLVRRRMCTTGTQTHVHHWYADAIGFTCQTYTRWTIQENDTGEYGLTLAGEVGKQRSHAWQHSHRRHV
jgi:hypothetical protein